jgi:predicted metal-dependent hydrolase
MKGYKQHLRVNIGGESVPVILTAMQRKTIRLVITDTGEIDLRIPLLSNQDHVAGFLQQHENWILQRRWELLQRQQQASDAVHYLGQNLTVGQWRNGWVGLNGQQILVPAHLDLSQRQQALDQWFANTARQYFAREISRWWPSFAHTGPQPVMRVKKMRTRWGSLSKRGYINLNQLLIHSEPRLIELVVVHELCHLEYFDHGRGFQALMTQHLPDWRERDQALRQLRINGFSLGC